MQANEAMQCALGYAWGQEDASGSKTYEPKPATTSGSFSFAEAFAAGWAEYNAELRHFMVCVSDAYRRWNETEGETIFPARSQKLTTPAASSRDI